MNEMDEHIKEIMKWAYDISGGWDGDNAGIEEDRAQLAEEIMEATEQLNDLILTMEGML